MQNLNCLREGVYYHYSNELFKIGDRLLARRKQVFQNAGWEYKFVERVFEEVRQSEFPTRPSRLSSVFVLTDPEFFGGRQYLYRIKCDGEMFETDQLLYTGAMRRPSKRLNVEELAREYWLAESVLYFPEVLVDGEVIVVSILTD
tara:strand:- start:1678 stop:2112 length:435 start_codon:yes stop_codon:yes gene_type:complete